MKKPFCAIVLLLFLISCGSSRKAYNKDMSFMYRSELSLLHPDYRIYHNSDSNTDVYYSINSSELLYSRQANQNDYTSRLLLSYTLMASYESKEIIDSGSVKITDINNENLKKKISGVLHIKAASPNNYLLTLSLIDLNRNQESETYIELNKTNSNASQNFLLESKEAGILFRNYINKDEEVKITYKRTAQNKLFVKYFKREFPIAAPPFSIIDPRPFPYVSDSVFTTSLDDLGSVSLTLSQPGIYNFVTDTNQREGFTIYRYYDGFPEINRIEQMIPPLRFIMSKEEFESTSNSKFPKTAMEGFWTNCAGNQGRAKEVIRKYYNRVRDANIYFSSYLEGWKTDRGMIYLIFGPPNLVYKSSDSETWVYGEDNNLNSINLNFNRVSNPIADNDYILQRSTIYKANWYRAVDLWRQGRIYLQN